MSSSTESISNGEEKKGNSKNNPKDEMPIVTSTMETDSKGARPKTSSTSEKSKKETVENKQFLKVLIMNASGDNKGDGTAARRKQTIIDVIKRHNPDLVLFQEFTWKESKWLIDTDPDNLKLTGIYQTKIMYNITKLNATEGPRNELDRILQEAIPPGFDPIPRMCLSVLNTMGVPVMKFICISWHGRHTGQSVDTKKKEFKKLMIFLNQIYVKINLPLLIAGDFNVDIDLIRKKVKHPFYPYKYKESARREERVIDYFIASKELCLSDIAPVNLKVSNTIIPEDMKLTADCIPLTQPDLSDKPPVDLKKDSKADNPLSDKPPVDLKKDSKADNPKDVLDHDPIIAMLELAPLSATAPAQDDFTDKLHGLKLD